MSIAAASLWHYVAALLYASAAVALAYIFRIQTQQLFGKLYAKELKYDANLTPQHFYLLTFVSGLSVAFLTLAIGMKLWIVFLFSAAAAILAPQVVLKRRREQFLRAFDIAMSNALVGIASSLKAGLTLRSSLELVAKNTADPFGKEVHHAVKEYHLGLSFSDALGKMKARVASENAQITIGALIIGNRLGGDLPKVLQRISATLRERERVHAKLRSLTSQGRTQGFILALAPPAVGIFMWMWDSQKFALMTDTLAGQCLLALAIILEVIGVLLTKKILDLRI